jgi:hypothetical protein
MKRHYEEGRVVVKGVVAGDGEEEVTLNIFILGTPDFLTAFVDNGVLVWVVSDSSSAGWGGEEVGEEFSFQGDGEQEIGEDRSRRGRRGNNGNRCFNNGRQEVFNGDVG